MNTYVFFKDGSDATIAMNLPLMSGEVVSTVTVGTVSPVTTSPLVPSQVAGPGDQVLLALTGGEPNVTYGIPVTVVTDQRTLALMAAVAVSDGVFVPYRTQDPDAYTDLIGELEAGQAAISTCVFSFPPDIDPTGGNVIWELVDSQGLVYASGNAFKFEVTNNGLSNIVVAKSVVTVPSDTPATIERPYQLRYTLALASPVDGQQSTFFSYENLTVRSLDVIPMGCHPSIELQGDQAQVSIVLDKAYDQVFVELYRDNSMVGSLRVTNPIRVSSGYHYASSLDTAQLPVNLVPYRVVWKYSQSSGPTYRDHTSLWVINATILSAIEDCRAKINKARTTLYGTPDHQFPPETIMTWLRRAADSFNGAYGNFTSFTFTNAKGVIREFWLLYAELFSVESQYLAEGEKAFNFQGAAISLDVDRTQYLEAAASRIQQRLDSECKALKQNLIIKGCVSGDGSADPYRLQKGAIGAVGITRTQASPWGLFRPVLPVR